MKLRHPLSGAIYCLQDDGLVRVEHDGKSGLFHADGSWHSGQLTQADIHLVGWIGGPQLATRGPLGSGRSQGAGASAGAPRAAPHSPQNLKLGGFSKPQAPHDARRAAPHCPQMSPLNAGGVVGTGMMVLRASTSLVTVSGSR